MYNTYIVLSTVGQIPPIGKCFTITCKHIIMIRSNIMMVVVVVVVVGTTTIARGSRSIRIAITIAVVVMVGSTM